MPNTEVKLSSAENTWMETSWEDREVLAFVYSPIAQSVERVTVNHDVVGSSPTWGAKKIETGLCPVSIFFVLTKWTRKAEKEKDLNGLFPAVARRASPTSRDTRYVDNFFLLPSKLIQINDLCM